MTIDGWIFHVLMGTRKYRIQGDWGLGPGRARRSGAGNQKAVDSDVTLSLSHPVKMGTVRGRRDG